MPDCTTVARRLCLEANHHFMQIFSFLFRQPRTAISHESLLYFAAQPARDSRIFLMRSSSCLGPGKIPLNPLEFGPSVGNLGWGGNLTVIKNGFQHQATTRVFGSTTRAELNASHHALAVLFLDEQTWVNRAPDRVRSLRGRREETIAMRDRPTAANATAEGKYTMVVQVRNRYRMRLPGP